MVTGKLSLEWIEAMILFLKENPPMLPQKQLRISEINHHGILGRAYKNQRWSSIDNHMFFGYIGYNNISK